MEFISENFSDLDGHKYPLNLEVGSDNLSDEERNKNHLNTEVVSENISFFRESYHPFSTELLSTGSTTIAKVNTRVNGTAHHILHGRISNIFFKLLDEDARIKQLKILIRLLHVIYQNI
jgi:hypothetical protein